MWSRVLVCGASLCVAACGHPGGAPPDLPTLAPEVDAMPADPAAPTVLDSGAEPRAVVRYHPREQLQRAIDVKIDLANETASGPDASPSSILDGTVKVTGVHGPVIDTWLTVDAVDVVANGNSPASTDLRRSGLTPLIGTAEKLRYSDTGRRLDVTVASASSRNQAILIAQLGHLADVGLVRFPDSELGRGGRWSEDVDDVPALPFPVRAELTVVDITDDRVHVHGTLAGTHPGRAANGEVDDITVTGELDATIDTGALTGTTTLTLQVKQTTEPVSETVTITRR